MRLGRSRMRSGMMWYSSSHDDILLWSIEVFCNLHIPRSCWRIWIGLQDFVKVFKKNCITQGLLWIVHPTCFWMPYNFSSHSALIQLTRSFIWERHHFGRTSPNDPLLIRYVEIKLKKFSFFTTLKPIQSVQREWILFNILYDVLWRLSPSFNSFVRCAFMVVDKLYCWITMGRECLARI